ncbi:flagellar hook-basal body complex protein [Acetobacter fallax]|uniref:Flagellar hook protein FlgE n=1 Tax=Acetobacter fallax TaxID=1737473 RepID=A0ABX0KFD4_9PROT|nr:flagellar hook-basal body complex protein [Acetobacter fallax]NHO33831.1 flagellar hook-basal body complex protein [Acetobacter fallax]NHO37390.1 flagellar hook-basal body complex protein [Acetobacter fallax]
MSIFNSLTTATAGINAQSTAFTNLSNNIANSQTVGYKASETSFQDFVSNSLSTPSTQAVSDGVGAVTTSQTQQQGTISTSTNALAVAISGNGFFDVVKPSGQATSGTEAFGGQQYFTRNGDFSTDKNGYLVNTSGYYLEGYQADPKTGTLSTSLTTLQASDIAFRPTETTTLTTAGTLTSGSATSSEETVYDSEGNAHSLDVSWSTPTPDPSTGGWTSTVSFALPSTEPAAGATDSSGYALPVMSLSTPAPTYTVSFDSSGNITSVTDSSGQAVGTGYSGSAASLPVDLTFTSGTSATQKTDTSTTQTVNLDIGNIGSSAGITVPVSGATSTPVTLTSDSATSATYEGLAMQTDGSVLATFSNGDTQLVGKIALSSFNNADGLMAVDGQAYVATSDSGSARTGMVGANGTGSLETSSTESSTTDLTSDLSNLIVTQEAYSANTKVVTTADTLLQATIAMIR